MIEERHNGEFPDHVEENRAIWEANALWWDDRIGDGNAHQIQLIEPATERLLGIQPGDAVLDIACGAGRLARRMAELGASVVGFDQSAKFIERARQRTPKDARIDYRVIDTTDAKALESFGTGQFDKAVCTMALMDMPAIEPLFTAIPRLLKPLGVFVFSVIHPCFDSPTMQRFCETHEDAAGRFTFRTGVKIVSYRTPFAKKSEGIVGQPEPQFYFHRPLSVLLGAAFQAGLVLDGIEEPGFASLEKPKPGIRWDDMPDIPPVLVVRMRIAP